MNDNVLQQLEDTANNLIQAYQGLKEENQTLQALCDELQGKHQVAQERVQNLIQRLKTIESHA